MNQLTQSVLKRKLNQRSKVFYNKKILRNHSDLLKSNGSGIILQPLKKQHKRLWIIIK